jgi:hypothetical protein
VEPIPVENRLSHQQSGVDDNACGNSTIMLLFGLWHGLLWFMTSLQSLPFDFPPSLLWRSEGQVGIALR